MAKLGTWEYDAQSDTVHWSGMYKQIMGVPRDFEPDAAFWYTLVHPDDVQTATSSRDRAIQSGDSYLQQYRIFRKSDGALRYVKAHTRIERDESGAVRRMIGVLQDITDELEVGERIRESEELYRSAFERAVIGMAHVGLDGRFLRVNRSLCEILRYSAEELMERKAGEIVHPDDAAPLDESLRGIVQRRATEMESVRRFLRKDGATVWLSISSTVMPGRDGDPLYILSSIQDITARVQAQAALARSERRLKRAQELAHTGNWEIDLGTMTMWASDEAFRIYGLTKNEQNTLPLKVPQESVLPEYRPMLDEALDRLLKHDAPYDLEFSVARAEDGAHRAVHSIAVVDRDKQGRPLKVIGVLQDVTDRRRRRRNRQGALHAGRLLAVRQPRPVTWSTSAIGPVGFPGGAGRHAPQRAGVQPDLEAVKQRRMRCAPLRAGCSKPS